tara:strand:+ start:172 stop:381 length:210 start_codon:yes stop_codon:yes gene_type:complete
LLSDEDKNGYWLGRSIGNDVDKALEHLYLVEDHFDYPEDISKAIDWLQKLQSGKAVWMCKGKGYWVESK